MEALSEDLKDNQYYVELLDTLIEENDLPLKYRLQKADTYGQFLREQAEMVMDETIEYSRRNNTSFPIASAAIIDNWKARILD